MSLLAQEMLRHVRIASGDAREIVDAGPDALAGLGREIASQSALTELPDHPR